MKRKMPKSKEDIYIGAIQYSLRLCTNKRYTIKGMTEKLEKNLAKQDGSDQDKAETILRVLARLTELNYLNDSQFSIDYIKEKSRFNPKGKYLLSQELYRKGVDKELIEQAFPKAEYDEDGCCDRLFQKKSRKWEKLEKYTRKNKAFQYLASKGFNIESIYKTLNTHYSK